MTMFPRALLEDGKVPYVPECDQTAGRMQQSTSTNWPGEQERPQIARRSLAITQQVGEWPEAADWCSGKSPDARLAFRHSHPDVIVTTGPGGFWQADYRSPDGRIAYKARYELPALLDEVEEELGDA